MTPYPSIITTTFGDADQSVKIDASSLKVNRISTENLGTSDGDKTLQIGVENEFSNKIASDTKKSEEIQEWSFWNLYGGISMALLASVLFSASFLMIKMLEPHGVKGFGASLLLNLGVVIPSTILIIFNEFGPGWQNRSRVLQGVWPITRETALGFMLIQGLFQASSVILRSLSLGYLSPMDMTVIVLSSPVITTILAHFMLGEKCGVIFIGIAIFTLCGVGCVTKPPIFIGAKEFDKYALIGSAYAFGGMLALSMKFVVTRKIKETHYLAMTFFLGFTGVVVSLPLFLAFESPNSLIPDSGTGLCLRLGLFSGFGAVASINMALKMENAGVVSLVRSFDVVCAFFFQYIFMGLVPDMLSAIGGAIVWTGVLVAGIQKYWSNKTGSRKKSDPLQLFG